MENKTAFMEQINKGEYDPPNEFIKQFEEQEKFFMRAQIMGIVSGNWKPSVLDNIEEDVKFTEEEIENLISVFLYKVSSDYKIYDWIQERMYDISIEVLSDYCFEKYAAKKQLEEEPKKKKKFSFFRK